MKNLKLLKKYILILTTTFVFFIFGLYWASRILTPKGEMEKFYDEPKNTIDVLVVGSSHSMSAFSPTQIYQETGLTAYNLSTWSQPVWVSYHYIIEALKYQQPQVVVVDVFGAFYDKSYITGVDIDLVSNDYASLIKPSLNLLALNFARRQVQVTRQPWDEYMNITKYHSRINRLEKEDFTDVFFDNYNTGKGYGPIYTFENFSDFSIPQTDAREPLYSHAAEYVNKIITLSQKEGFTLIFTKAPYITETTDIALINTIEDICTQNNIAFIDFCRENIANIDYGQDMADHGHLNYKGAVKTTSVLSDYLNTLQLGTRLSAESISMWNHALETENDNFNIMDIKLSKSFSEMINKADMHNDTSVIIMNQGNLSEDDYHNMQLIFDGTVLEQYFDKIKNSDITIFNGTLLDQESSMTLLAELKMTFEVTNSGITSLVYNESEYSRQRDGLNIALYNNSTGEIYHYISFAKEHNWTPYTK